MRVCQGLKSEGIEPIIEEETAWLTKRARRNVWNIVIFVGGSFLFLIFLILAITPIGNAYPWPVGIAIVAIVVTMARNNQTDLRALRSARCQWVEVFSEPLPEAVFALEEQRVDENYDSLADVQVPMPMRRLIPTGEVIRWDGSRMIEPVYAPVFVPPQIEVENPASTRNLNAGERSELFRSQWETWVVALLLILAGLGIAWVSAQNPHDKSLAAVIGMGVINSVALGLFLLGLFHLFGNSKATDLRDGQAYVNGQQEKLASGRLWRFGDVPALDRWRKARD